MAGLRNTDLVVVGADGSWHSQKAVVAATREAARRAATLLVLTIAQGQWVSAGVSPVGRPEQDEMEFARASSKRAVMLAKATDGGVCIEVAVLPSVDGRVLDGVVDRTVLLVLGGEGRRGLAAFSMASTSGDLVRRFRTPVLLPRMESAAKHSVVSRPPEVHVGLSGSRDESDLLRLAAAEAAWRNSRLRVIHAVPAPHREDWLHQQTRETWSCVRSVPECGAVTTEVEVVHEDPVAALLARCDADDLLVVGTRGGGRLAGLVSGSVARGVLDALACDVIVVPPGARIRARAGDEHTEGIQPRA